MKYMYNTIWLRTLREEANTKNLHERVVIHLDLMNVSVNQPTQMKYMRRFLKFWETDALKYFVTMVNRDIV